MISTTSLMMLCIRKIIHNNPYQLKTRAVIKIFQHHLMTCLEFRNFRLAHVSYKIILRLPNIPQAPEAISKGEKPCEDCLAGKMKEIFSKKIYKLTFKIARRLRADISGKPPTLIQGYNYFLVIIDDALRCGWVKLLKNKSIVEFLPSIKEMTIHVQLIPGKRTYSSQLIIVLENSVNS